VNARENDVTLSKPASTAARATVVSCVARWSIAAITRAARR